MIPERANTVTATLMTVDASLHVFGNTDCLDTTDVLFKIVGVTILGNFAITISSPATIATEPST